MPKKKYYPGYQYGGSPRPDVKLKGYTKLLLSKSREEQMKEYFRENPEAYHEYLGRNSGIAGLLGGAWKGAKRGGHAAREFMRRMMGGKRSPEPGAVPGVDPWQYPHPLPGPRQYPEGPPDSLPEGIMQVASGGSIPGYAEGDPVQNLQQGTRTTSYQMPGQTGEAWDALLARTQAEGGRGYQQYGGKRLEGFDPAQAAAMRAQELYSQGAGPQGTIQAGQTLAGAGTMLQGAQGRLQGLQAGQQGIADTLGTAATDVAARQGVLGQGMATLAGTGQAALTGLGGTMGTAGDAALAAQQGFGAGQVGFGAGAATAAAGREAAANLIGTQAQ